MIRLYTAIVVGWTLTSGVPVQAPHKPAPKPPAAAKSGTPKPGFDLSKFKDARRAATAINAATDVGINRLKYHELLQDLATEIQLLDGLAEGAREERALSLLNSILSNYSQAERWWKQSSELAVSISEATDDPQARLEYLSIKRITDGGLQLSWQEAKLNLDRISNIAAGKGYSEGLFERIDEFEKARQSWEALAATRNKTPPSTPCVTGTWNVALELPNISATPTLTLKQDGEVLTGDYISAQYRTFLTGTVKGSDLTFKFAMTVEGNMYDVTYSGTIDKDTMNGSVNVGAAMSGTFTAARKK